FVVYFGLTIYKQYTQKDPVIRKGGGCGLTVGCDYWRGRRNWPAGEESENAAAVAFLRFNFRVSLRLLAGHEAGFGEQTAEVPAFGSMTPTIHTEGHIE